MSIRRARGFSLVELMIATVVVLMVFAGASYAAVQLHRRGVLEQAVADLQDVARGSRELVAPRIEHAGSGAANLGVTMGAAAGLPDIRGSFSLKSGAVVPPAPYGGLTSDSLDLYWGEAEMITLADCGAGSARNGNDICVQRLPTSSSQLNVNDFILVANPNPLIAISCVFQVQGLIPGAPSHVQIVPLAWADSAPAPSPCPTPTASFWTGPDAYAVKLAGASFRIDWTAPSGVPRLQYDPDGWWNPTSGWLPVADNVERMQIRVGLVSRDLLNPNPIPVTAPPAPPPIIWFPDFAPAPARPSLDGCIAGNPLCVLGPGNIDPFFRDNPDVVDAQFAADLGGGAANPSTVLQAQLLRRARMVELNLTVRSARQDPALIQTVGPGFAVDGAGNPMDGRTRRHYEMRVSLRNYGYAGI